MKPFRDDSTAARFFTVRRLKALRYALQLRQRQPTGSLIRAVPDTLCGLRICVISDLVHNARNEHWFRDRKFFLWSRLGYSAMQP
jgi:hypothetical protein